MSEHPSIHDSGYATEPVGQPTHEPSQGGANTYQIGGLHYTKMRVQPWDVVDSWPIEQRVGFYRGNAVKYLMRMGSKDEQLQEARKAWHYLDKLIETLEAERSVSNVAVHDRGPR